MSEALVPTRMLEKAARRFRMLGEPVRLDILNQLNVRGEMAVQDLVEATGQQQANVSKHLRLLMDEGCVERRKEGLYSFYRISDPTLSAMCLLVCSRIREEQDSTGRETPS